MAFLSVCILTFNSKRTVKECLPPLLKVADELVVVDSGSTDGTLEVLREMGIEPLFRAYTTHAEQMNYAVGHASHDWVLCMDSDEILSAEGVETLLALKQVLSDPDTAYRIRRHWHVLGREVHAMYPVSCPDYPVRLFHRDRGRFNDAPVDDKPVGFARTEVMDAPVIHKTFFSLHEMFSKLNIYTSRLVRYKKIRPSLVRGVFSSIGGFGKWYFRREAWKDGRVGVVTAVYASMYGFLKYLKAWFHAKNPRRL